MCRAIRTTTTEKSLRSLPARAKCLRLRVVCLRLLLRRVTQFGSERWGTLDELQRAEPSLRQKLIVAGIPETEHAIDALAARIPDIEPGLLQNLPADTVAELLLYLISKGVVSLGVPSGKALLDLPWGSHVCQFYETKKDQLDMLVPYFKHGLERNEPCAWLVADLTVEEGDACAPGRGAGPPQVHGERPDAGSALFGVLHRPERRSEGTGAAELSVRRHGGRAPGSRDSKGFGRPAASASTRTTRACPAS